VKKALRVALGLGLLVAAALGVFLARHYEPRRARPEDWRTPWAELPLETETAWSLQRTRREVVQQFFFEATDELTHCNAEYFRGADSSPTQLELLIDVHGGAAELRYVIGENRPELPPGLVPCVERALEKTHPVRHPGLADLDDVRWRMGLTFLFHPPVELRPTHWWDALLPDAWRSGGNSAIHVG
jgi:hypothetical protein